MHLVRLLYDVLDCLSQTAGEWSPPQRTSDYWDLGTGTPWTISLSYRTWGAWPFTEDRVRRIHSCLLGMRQV